MLKRYVPLTAPNGIVKTFDLPSTYVGGAITLFVNGALSNVENDPTHPFGYILDQTAKTFTFYNAPMSFDTIYVIYDDSGEDGGTGGSGSYSGIVRYRKGYNLVSWQGNICAKWNSTLGTVEYDPNILANVQNILIDQIEWRYGVPASDIIREFTMYNEDTGGYMLYIPGSTSPCWKGDGTHTVNATLFETGGVYDYNDPTFGSVFYNPGNFILAATLLENGQIVSSDTDNPISDLPDGLRRGLNMYVYDHPALDSTGGLLEIHF